MTWPEIDNRAVRAVANALYSRRWAIATPNGSSPRLISLAEAALARRFGCDHAIMTCNGSAAIVLAMQALGIGPGSRVLVPACTWIGCVTAIMRLGANPVICDAGEHRLVPDPKVHSSGPVDAVLTVPLYAQGVDMAAVRRTHPKAKIVLDLSHLSCSGAIGAPLDYADAIVSSFQASKVLTCGEGGFVGVNEPEVARSIEALRTDGRVLKNGELLPHGRVHGANYAPSEISAALLLDQLDRLDEQRTRRAAGGSALLDGLHSNGLTTFADPDVIADGLHYGVPVAVTEDPKTVLSSVFQNAGVQLMPCYPALAEGPLFHKEREQRYNEVKMHTVPTPNAQLWHRRCVIVPHEVLLASRSSIQGLVDILAGQQPATTPKQHSTHPPSITVLVHTRADRNTLDRALASIASQRYGGEIQTILVCDCCDVPSRDLPIPVKNVRIDLPEKVLIGRLAKLRDMAVRLVETPLLCFLDDDNWWDPDHLSSLVAVMEGNGAPAAHSWRMMHCSDGAAFNGSHFPWLERDTPEERRQYQRCVRNRIMTPDDAVIRDQARIGKNGEPGMVDLGAWLLRTHLAKLHGFRAAPRKSSRPVLGVGEDDILLAQLVDANTAIVCSGQATLHYQLGGFSNAPHLQSKAWELPNAS